MTLPDSTAVASTGTSPQDAAPQPESVPTPTEDKVREIGGRRDGTDPTRFGDWEKGGRCIDF